MSTNRLTLLELKRYLESGVEESLSFEPGVNVLVGPPNSGKSKWLSMLDYLLGSKETPEEAMGEDLAEKYSRLELRAQVGETEARIERHWKEPGMKHKILVNGQALSETDFAYYLMERLDIPLVHYPQGNPYGVRAWPELNWRSLLRHVYRQQNYWSDLADRQPESEQHACLLQFLGLAKAQFSSEYGNLVAKEKQIIELHALREQFTSMLDQVSRELLDERDAGVAVTSLSIDTAEERIRADIGRLQAKRSEILDAVSSALSCQSSVSSHVDVQAIGVRLAELHVEKGNLEDQIAQASERYREVSEYKDTLSAELTRLSRAHTATEVFAELRVTHCPACDRPLRRETTPDELRCHVCGQERPVTVAGDEAGGGRVELEVDQLRGESGEMAELLRALSDDLGALNTRKQRIQEEIRRLEALAWPIQQAAAAIVPAEITVVDMETGQLHERLRQLGRIRQALARRDRLQEQIAEVTQEAARLEQEVETQRHSVDFDRAAETLEEGINAYFDAINRSGQVRWTQGRASVRLREKSLRILVNTSDWDSKLGGTMRLFFLIGYHFGLLSLCSRSETHFPGLLVIDFPPELEDGVSVMDRENFVLEPFVDLLGRDSVAGAQVIAAGSSFANLRGAHRIELTHIWK